jgi:calcineurin-like phosphoesterase family protein
MIYFTADTHFRHGNIIRTCGRPFADVKAMDNTLIKKWDGFFHDSIHLYGHVHNGGGKPSYMEQFSQIGKRAVNVGVDIQGFHPVSIEEIIRLADG